MLDTVRENERDVPNKAKIKDGIRRFKRGICTRKGKKDADQRRHLDYNLMQDEDLTWDHALEVASRWEAANDASPEPEPGSSDNEGEVETGKEERRKKKNEEMELTIISAVEFATLIDKVDTNSRNIKEMKKDQESLTASINSWREETNSTLSQILTSVQTLQREFEFACDEPSK